MSKRVCRESNLRFDARSFAGLYYYDYYRFTARKNDGVN